MKTETAKAPSLHLGDTAVVLVMVFLFYPMSIAPIGEASNGDVLGLGFLAIAFFFAWRAVIRNERSPWLRRLWQLPLATFVTLLALRDAYAQHMTHWRWW